MSLFRKREPKIVVPNQRAVAIAHFRELIKPWRRKFTEDNWPTTADHLHELLHLAMVEEGASPEWIAFACGSHAIKPPPSADGDA